MSSIDEVPYYFGFDQELEKDIRKFRELEHPTPSDVVTYRRRCRKYMKKLEKEMAPLRKDLKEVKQQNQREYRANPDKIYPWHTDSGQRQISLEGQLSTLGSRAHRILRFQREVSSVRHSILDILSYYLGQHRSSRKKP